jgi:hypothetical protein
MKHLNSFLNHWGDAPSIEKLRASHKSKDVQKAEAENYLKGMALRFERSPNQSTLKLWADDIIESGYSDEVLKEVCKSAPFKFERHPTLNQLMELLRPYKPKLDGIVDELLDLQNRCYYHLKTKFIKLADEETFNKMVEYYASKEPELKNFNVYFIEICVLGDWLRSYFKDGAAILKQREITVQKIIEGDREYFIRFYNNYAKENNL